LIGNVASTAREYLERTAADACLLQELWLRAEKRAGGAAARAKCSLSSAGSTSAGVGVDVPSHLGLALPRHEPDIDIIASRMQVRGMGAICNFGVHLVSTYLWCSEGLSLRNLDVLQCVAQVLQRLRGPWLVGGDFNLEPALLQQSGWLGLVRGVVHAPAGATCDGGTYDYFVASRSLSAGGAEDIYSLGCWYQSSFAIALMVTGCTPQIASALLGCSHNIWCSFA
jgi:hypothetical protein